MKKSLILVLITLVIFFSSGERTKANSENNWGATDLILDSEIDLDQLNHNLIEASKKRRTNDVNFLLSRGADVNAKDLYGRTALSWVALNGDIDTLLVLLDWGVDVNTENNYGTTALMTAVAGGHIEIIQLLLENQADPNARNRYGTTALIRAANKGDIEAARLLLKYEADVNAKDNYNSTALIQISAYKEAIKGSNKVSLKFAQLLLDYEANINAQNKAQETALIQATKAGKAQLVQLLLEAGADVHLKDLSGWTALDWAKHNKHNTTILKLLLDYDAKANPEKGSQQMDLFEDLRLWR